jgi:hypothetical protein
MGASYFNGNPRAKRLMGKELLVEFAYCEGYAETLSRFTEMLGIAIAFPERYRWPERPKILSRGTSSVRAAALRMSVKQARTAATNHAAVVRTSRFGVGWTAKSRVRGL